MSDYHQLWRTLFLVKDYLIEYKIDGFSSFDLTDNPNKIHGNSFKIPVKSSEDVVYFLKFYNILGDLTEKDIDNLHKEKGYDCFNNISLVLVV
jgi:hypothetical protein